MINYGGYDDPNPENRTTDYRPKDFVPRLNPFYCALPFNDTEAYNRTKLLASRVVPWYRTTFKRHGKSVIKGRWIAINYGKRTCYAQWEDVGPFNTDDWMYVFGNSRPRNQRNKGAGLDVSPAVRDYLGMASGAACNWRFVELNEVPLGPWRKFGENNDFIQLEREMNKQKAERLRQLREQRDAMMRNGTLPR